MRPAQEGSTKARNLFQIQFERDGSRCLVVCSVMLDDDGGAGVVCSEISGMRVVGEVKVG